MVNVLLPRLAAFECRSERDLKGLAPILRVMDKLMGPIMRTRIAAPAAALLMALALPAGAAGDDCDLAVEPAHISPLTHALRLRRSSVRRAHQVKPAR